MVVRKLFRIAFALFVKAYRIASHFFHLFGQYFTVNAPKSFEKGEKNAKNMQKKSAKSAKCDAKMGSKFASHYCNKIFSHRIRIALPSLGATSPCGLSEVSSRR
jgi:hypothetical protein